MNAALPDGNPDAIPEPINHIGTAVDAGIVAGARASDWGGIPMSAVTTECDRSIWYSLRWAHEPERPAAKKERIFETGRIYETRLIAYARAGGMTVQDVDPATGKQWAVTLADGAVRGKLDGVVTGVPTAEKAEHVLECKSLKAADFRSILKHGLAKAKPDHFAQCQLYMHATGIHRALYAGANKDTDELHWERLHYDPAFCLALESRMARIAGAATAPAKISDDGKAFACQWCKAADICHAGEWSRQHCRTCLHSSVTGNVWTCARHGRDLSWADQKAGCDDHRFIPALVPGEQVDVIDGDLIVYRMADGSNWIDGRRM
jgi:hypothetical protein